MKHLALFITSILLLSTLASALSLGNEIGTTISVGNVTDTDDDPDTNSTDTDDTDTDEDDSDSNDPDSDTDSDSDSDDSNDNDREDKGKPRIPGITGSVSDDYDTNTDSETDESSHAPVKKPKEIVVVGSKIRQGKTANTLSADELQAWTSVLDIELKTDEDLERFIEALVILNEDIESIEINNGTLLFKHKHKAKFLALFNIEYTANSEVDPQGRVKVKFPWHLILATDNASELEAELNERLPKIDDPSHLMYYKLLIKTHSNISKSHK
tara:strand:- start:3822 stop:4631 length:810 start_codon:yes stop_codon:yes gene_type:complete